MSFTNKIVDKVYVINLEKDKERLRSISSQLKEQHIEFERFNGIDGSTIEEDPRITELCNKACPNGIKGCALSHKTIWESMIENKYEHLLILEDDAILNSNMDVELQLLWANVPNDFDILYLGSTFYCGDTSIYNKIVSSFGGHKLENVSDGILKTQGCGGLYGYIVSLKGAKELVKDPIPFHVDDFIGDQIKEKHLNSYAFHPVLVEANNKKSNLSESYPPLLSSLLSNIPLTNQKNNQSLNWLLKESFTQIGLIPICSLMIIIFFLCFLIPIDYYFIIYIWILFEFFASGSLRYTIFYIFLISIPYLIKKSL